MKALGKAFKNARANVRCGTRLLRSTSTQRLNPSTRTNHIQLIALFHNLHGQRIVDVFQVDTVGTHDTIVDSAQTHVSLKRTHYPSPHTNTLNLHSTARQKKTCGKILKKKTKIKKNFLNNQLINSPNFAMRLNVTPN
jgi:hypothetical protein